jgi:hypothetical protein
MQVCLEAAATEMVEYELSSLIFMQCPCYRVLVIQCSVLDIVSLSCSDCYAVSLLSAVASEL